MLKNAQDVVISTFLKKLDRLQKGKNPNLQHLSDQIVEEKSRTKRNLKSLGINSELSESDLMEKKWHSVSGFNLRYAYQRASIKYISKNFFSQIYRAKSRSKDFSLGKLTSCGQAAISATILATHKVYPHSRISFLHGGYFETLLFIKEHGLKCNFIDAISQKIKLLYVDSSTLPKNFDWHNLKFPTGTLVLFDTTCWPVGSSQMQLLAQKINASNCIGIFCRSHLKLDTMGMEYGRLGSVAILCPRKREQEAGKIFEQIEFYLRHTGGIASTDSIYPFLRNPSFHQAGLKWASKIQTTNASFSKILQDQIRIHNLRKIKIVEFDHQLYFWMVIQRRVAEKEKHKLAIKLREILSFYQIPARTIASYPWDFIALTCFEAKASFGTLHEQKKTVLRISMPGIINANSPSLAQAFKYWMFYVNRVQ
jgi:hypothetical protein